MITPAKTLAIINGLEAAGFSASSLIAMHPRILPVLLILLGGEMDEVSAKRILATLALIGGAGATFFFAYGMGLA